MNRKLGILEHAVLTFDFGLDPRRSLLREGDGESDPF